MNERLGCRCLTLLALLACSDAGSGGSTGGTIVVAVPGNWSQAPPPVNVDLFGREVADQLYDRLAEIGPGLNTVGDAGFAPRLARAWTWSKDSLSIAFDLDPRARWHDGQPVRAADVRFTLALIKDPKTASGVAPSVTNVDSVSVRDSLTPVVWYHRRSPEQFFDFVYQVHIIPEHIWKGVPRDKLTASDAARSPIGSGRFRFSRYEPGVRLELVSDTANYRGRARLDRVVFSIAPDIGAAITQVMTGQADFLEFLPPDLAPKVDSSATHRIQKYAGLTFSFVGFNFRDQRRKTDAHPILGDRRVRRALSMALDRQSMLRNVFDTNGILGSGPYPRVLADTTVKPPAFDLAHARALLDSAGWTMGAYGIRWKDGKSLALTVIVPSSSRPRMRYAVLLQDQWKAVGVAVAIDQMEFATFRDRQGKGDFDVTMGSSGYDPSQAPALRQGWSTSGIGREGQNILSYSNHVFDALIDSALTSAQPDKARSYAHRAIETLMDDAPAVWIFDNTTLAAVHRRIRIEGMRADEWWAGLADWWIPENARIERDRIGLRPASP